jgi:hypothetical protein
MLKVQGTYDYDLGKDKYLLGTLIVVVGIIKNWKNYKDVMTWEWMGEGYTMIAHALALTFV